MQLVECYGIANAITLFINKESCCDYYIVLYLSYGMKEFEELDRHICFCELMKDVYDSLIEIHSKDL